MSEPQGTGSAAPETDTASGITNRPLDHERHEQEKLPLRGERKGEPLEDPDAVEDPVETSEATPAPDARSVRRLDETGEAFERRGHSHFAVCERCGAPIELDRLRADPRVAVCSGCASKATQPPLG